MSIKTYFIILVVILALVYLTALVFYNLFMEKRNMLRRRFTPNQVLRTWICIINDPECPLSGRPRGLTKEQLQTINDWLDANMLDIENEMVFADKCRRVNKLD